MKNKLNITPTAISDEFDLRNGGVKAHFKLIKTHPSGRRAYLRTEHVTGKTSFEVIQPIKHKLADGSICKSEDSQSEVCKSEVIFTYPSNEKFGTHGVYIAGDDIFRDEKMDYYLENGFAVSYSQYLRNNRS